MSRPTTLQCVQALAMYMQRGFMSGAKTYGQAGFPNMQSILELSAMDADEALTAVSTVPEVMECLRLVMES